jgi:hypothetical protein
MNLIHDILARHFASAVPKHSVIPEYNGTYNEDDERRASEANAAKAKVESPTARDAVTHTPGPWRTPCEVLARCNAHDDLLAALREFLDLCPRMSDDDPIAPALADACRSARAVIERAER